MEHTTAIVSTDRCFLRCATVSDYDALVAGIGAPAFPPQLPLANLQRHGKLKSWLDSILAMSSDGRACVFSIDLRTGEHCIGQVSLVQRDESASWNLAFWLHPAYWGRGLAVETATAAVQYAFTVMAIQEIWAGAAAWNQRSIKTLLELGLHPIEADETLNGESDTSQAIRTFSVSRDGWLRASNDDAI
ncbi:RimJ/RimL family protein N-acetyltransferase [Paraburkholderia sp. GAS41]|jgi:RimJ/RimL family protein N-acetyltransferase|uniref:GNAT family N-acetyltransferase n=1 Tax=Paraburkholderia sp. GAS41 TaxID=3035134 RepID=UPI003D1B8D38